MYFGFDSIFHFAFESNEEPILMHRKIDGSSAINMSSLPVGWQPIQFIVIPCHPAFISFRLENDPQIVGICFGRKDDGFHRS